MLPRQRKILLVEDNPEHVQIYKIEMEAAGFQVFHTNDPEEVQLLAENKNPNIILLDLMLGNTSGLDILRKLKSNPKTAHIRIVALTNFKEKELLGDQRLEGIDGYIFKGDYTPKEVVRMVSEYLK